MTVTTQFPALNLTSYRAEELPRIARALEELVGETPHWLSSPQPGLVLVTASLHAHLVGCIAGQVEAGVVTIIETLESTWARNHESVNAALVEGLLDAVDQPWVQVRVDRGSPAAVYLLGAGWEPEPRTEPSHQLILSGAHAA